MIDIRESRRRYFSVRCRQNARMVRQPRSPSLSIIAARDSPVPKMDLATLSLFLPNCFALNMAPDPKKLLSVNQLWRANPQA